MDRARTLYDKLIGTHTFPRLDEKRGPGAEVLPYVDRTVVNEHTSPQAFGGLRQAGRQVSRPEAALGVVDHVNPIASARIAAMPDEGGAGQVAYFERNCRDFGIDLPDVLHPLQGIEHVLAPELGFILPGMAAAATATTPYGALGFGAGTSDFEHYLATRTPATDEPTVATFWARATDPEHNRLTINLPDESVTAQDGFGARFAITTGRKLSLMRASTPSAEPSITRRRSRT